MGGRRLIAPKSYKLRKGQSSLSLNLPKLVTMHTKLEVGDELWLYTNRAGELVLTNVQDRCLQESGNGV